MCTVMMDTVVEPLTCTRLTRQVQANKSKLRSISVTLSVLAPYYGTNDGGAILYEAIRG